MPILNFNLNNVGQTGVNPSFIYIETNDTQTEVLATGYLNGIQSQTGLLNESMLAIVTTKTSPSAASIDVGTYELAFSSGNWSLSTTDSPGSVILPTIANYFATYADANGVLTKNAATAINGGNIQAGLSGTAGYLASFPSTASKGSLRVTAVANTGNTVTTISNAAMGQATVVSIPDPGAATANFLLSAISGTQHITSGSLEVDAGNIIAGSSGSSGGLVSYSATAARGYLQIYATANAGDTITSVTNASMGQASIISIPDPGAATANFIISALSGAGIQHITTGSLEVDAGNILAGSSGAAGYMASFPATAARGSLRLTAIENTGDTVTTISNAAMGQASVVSIPDPGAATANFILSAATATQTIGTGLSIVGGNNVQITGGGNFIAGASGAAGALYSYPATAARGSLAIVAVENTGDTVTTISNAAMGQASVISIPDPAAATANFIISNASGTQTISTGSLAVSTGNITAGSSGSSGAFSTYSATAARGSLQLFATANSGDTVTSITNSAMGQASIIHIPDPANANAQFLVGATTTPFTSGNFPVASGVNGLMVDSGMAAANIQNKTNIIANTTADIGGGGAGPISVVVAGATAASKVVATIASSSNTVAVAKCIATATGFDITFTADPGAACVVNYVLFIASQ